MKTKLTTISLFVALALSLRAAPIAFDELSLLVRMRETDSFITEQITQRRLIRALAPEQEATLIALGASDTILRVLRRQNSRLSDSDATAFETRRVQQKRAIQEAMAAEAATHEAALAALAEQMRAVESAKSNARIAAEMATFPTVPHQFPSNHPWPLNAPSFYAPPIPNSAIGDSLPTYLPRTVSIPSPIQSTTQFGNATTFTGSTLGVPSTNRYAPNSLANPYGAGNPYKTDGLMNPYSQYGNQFSNKSWTNPYATNAPKLYGPDGSYHGRLSANPYAPDSTANQFGRYGNPYSPDSINNRFGAGNPYSTRPIYVQPQ